MSARLSPVCGRAFTMLSILTASTGPSDVTGSPVNGETRCWTTGVTGREPGPAGAGRARTTNRPTTTRTQPAAAPSAARMIVRRFCITTPAPESVPGRPGVHGLVGVHVLDVALGHPAQRRAPVEPPAPLQLVHGLRLPGRPGTAGQAALLDAVQAAVGVPRVHAPQGQALAGHWQQPPQRELGGRH